MREVVIPHQPAELRQAARAEIHTAARKLLVEQESAAVTINAFARQDAAGG
ncbi:hypothetical protein GCM10009850_072290 [Nonomuraea monospora]|uniref:Uncharacterized protein n=1 Tax=Nonomuraea monospora TaxID=568818 RepID=A0ABN3CRE0_9ACTN